MTYRYTRAERDYLDSGRVVVHGDLVRLSKRDAAAPMAARLIAYGALVPEPAPTPRRPARPKPTTQKER